jgi:Mce-associated membrane protein
MADGERSTAEDGAAPTTTASGDVRTVEEAAGDGTAGTPGSGPAGSGGGSRLGSARLAWLVAGIAVVALVSFAVVAVPALRAEAEREAISERAELVALRVTTFEGATIEEWAAGIRELATGEYAQQLDDVIDQEFRDALRAIEAESVGRIQSSFVQSVDGDTATAFVVARNTTRNAERPQPIEDEQRIEMTLRRVDGEWLAAEVSILGPQAPTVTPPPVDAPEEDAP